MPWLTCTVSEILVNDNSFPMEVPEVLKWSFLICSVPVAFKRVQTRVLVGAPGKSSSPSGSLGLPAPPRVLLNDSASHGGGGGLRRDLTPPPSDPKVIGQIFLRVFGQSKILSGAFGASQFGPKNFFGAFGASNKSGSPEGGGVAPQPPTPLGPPPLLRKTLPHPPFNPNCQNMCGGSRAETIGTRIPVVLAIEGWACIGAGGLASGEGLCRGMHLDLG